MDRIMKTLNKMIPKEITTRQIAEYLNSKGFNLRRMRGKYLDYYSEEFKETIIVGIKYTYTDCVLTVTVESVERSDVYDE